MMMASFHEAHASMAFQQAAVLMAELPSLYFSKVKMLAGEMEIKIIIQKYARRG